MKNLLTFFFFDLSFLFCAAGLGLLGYHGQVLEPHMGPAPSALQANEERQNRRISGEDEAGGKEQAKGREEGEEVVEDEQKVAARELMLILLCNRSLAHLK